MPRKAQALVFGTVGAGVLVVISAAGRASSVRPSVLWALAAAAILTELVQLEGDESAADPLDAHGFSFSSGVHLAAVIIAGPWAAALVAGTGVLVVDPLRGAHWKRVLYNASVFALAAFLGGSVFELLGAKPGAVDLPADFLAISGLALSYAVVNTLLVSLVVSLTKTVPFRPVMVDALRSEFAAATAEAGLGTASALLALHDAWGLIALLPLIGAVYLSQARLALLRRETARALETFANVVDERDPSTHSHSARVADYAAGLARALGLPASSVARLRWAGRLHDLGKIAVDTSVLRTAGSLSPDQWLTMQRHPRLSARLLRQFRFAAEEAQAAEYHHERYDGGGYYGMGGTEVPLASHFLIVADSYDAMTSDRPYRKGLSRTEALAEIEANLGTHFHPVVGKSFVAYQRGLDPLGVLTPAERAELRRLWRTTSGVRRRLRPPRRPEIIPATMAGVALLLLGLRQPMIAIGVAGLLAVDAALRALCLVRSHRLSRLLIKAADTSRAPEEVFRLVAQRLVEESTLFWAGILPASPSVPSGAIILESKHDAGDPDAGLVASWLSRETHGGSDWLTLEGREVGSRGHFVAAALDEGEREERRYLLLAFDSTPPRYVEIALRATHRRLAEGLTRPIEALRPTAAVG